MYYYAFVNEKMNFYWLKFSFLLILSSLQNLKITYLKLSYLILTTKNYSFIWINSSYSYQNLG